MCCICINNTQDEHYSQAIENNIANCPNPEKKCPNCDFSSPKNQLMKYHMRRGTTGELFSCKHCDYKNCSKKGLNFHVLKYHEKMRPTLRKHRKCPNCDFKSSYPEVLDAHIGEGKEEQVHFTNLKTLSEYETCHATM